MRYMRDMENDMFCPHCGITTGFSVLIVVFFPLGKDLMEVLSFPSKRKRIEYTSVQLPKMNSTSDFSMSPLSFEGNKAILIQKELDVLGIFYMIFLLLCFVLLILQLS